MKKFAARDYEDLLQVWLATHGLVNYRTNSWMQCAIPVFDGLLDEPYNTIVLQLLYRAAEWHALAKLRMHTEGTLKLLEDRTTSFGSLMRQFRNKTFTDFNTIGLPKESRKFPSSGRKKRSLNLNTYKFHSLGDYVHTIRLFGSTDNYSTLTVRKQQTFCSPFTYSWFRGSRCIALLNAFMR